MDLVNFNLEKISIVVKENSVPISYRASIITFYSFLNDLLSEQKKAFIMDYNDWKIYPMAIEPLLHSIKNDQYMIGFEMMVVIESPLTDSPEKVMDLKNINSFQHAYDVQTLSLVSFNLDLDLVESFDLLVKVLRKYERRIKKYIINIWNHIFDLYESDDSSTPVPRQHVEPSVKEEHLSLADEFGYINDGISQGIEGLDGIDENDVRKALGGLSNVPFENAGILNTMVETASPQSHQENVNDEGSNDEPPTKKEKAGIKVPQIPRIPRISKEDFRE